MSVVRMAVVVSAASLLVACGPAEVEGEELSSVPEMSEVEQSVDINTWTEVCWDVAGLYAASLPYCSGNNFKTFHRGHKVYVYTKSWTVLSCGSYYFSWIRDNYGNEGYMRTASLCD